MSTIVSYDFEQVRQFISKVVVNYQENLTQALTFEDWKCMAFPALYKNPSAFKVIPYKLGTTINVAPTAVEMLKIIKQHQDELQYIELNEPPEKQDFLKSQVFRKIFVPKYSFALDSIPTVKGILDGKECDVPIWFNTTMKSVNVRLGFDKLDSAKPGAIPLSDAPVHMLLGGITGAGKSVALNDIICSLLLEYPPWELSLILADFKIVELSRYANRIPTPHVKIVAATGSTEFALSTFDYIIDEMNARQEVFTACGVQNIKDFREKFNLCMPRILLVADEFVQMYENIKNSEQKGNDQAQEMKMQINAALSGIARLGRSQGVHMLLSSQNMDGVLDEQTAGQFSAGATLAATPQVSNTLIGNSAGSTLHGKGKAYVNLNKNEKNPDDNVLVRVPYIVSEISEEEASQGKLSYLQELLKQMQDAASLVGYSSIPYYYNENETLPRKLLYDALDDCKLYMLQPDEGSDVANQIYKQQVFARVPLGREVMYTTEKSASLSIRFKRYNNLLINADDVLSKYYICMLIGEMLSHFSDAFVLVSADEVLLRQTNLQAYCTQQDIRCEIDSTGSIPRRYINMVAARQSLLDLQNYLTTKNGTGAWEDSLALEFAYNRVAGKQKPPLASLEAFFVSKGLDSIRASYVEEIKLAFPTLDEGSRHVYESTIVGYAQFYDSFKKLTNNFSNTLCAGSFEKIVIWWLGADMISGLDTYETKNELAVFLSSSCQVGIFNVLVPSLRCTALDKFAAACNFILERCSKQFFLDVGLPRKININANSYQMHDRELGINRIIRFYS